MMNLLNQQVIAILSDVDLTVLLHIDQSHESPYLIPAVLPDKGGHVGKEHAAPAQNRQDVFTVFVHVKTRRRVEGEVSNVGGVLLDEIIQIFYKARDRRQVRRFQQGQGPGA